MRSPAAGAWLAVTALSVGCSVTPQDVGVTMDCGHGGRVNNSTLVTAAQSVPTAQLIPCVRLLPAGWSAGTIDLRRGSTRFVLASDRDGPTALTVLLHAGCDVRGATQVPSDQAGARRYERPERLTSGYRGKRYYVYSGGCTTYVFNLHGSSRAEPVNEASLAVGFVTRDAVRALVRRDTDNGLELDVPS